MIIGKIYFYEVDKTLNVYLRKDREGYWCRYVGDKKHIVQQSDNTNHFVKI